jgi:hypothetical protein
MACMRLIVSSKFKLFIIVAFIFVSFQFFKNSIVINPSHIPFEPIPTQPASVDLDKSDIFESQQCDPVDRNFKQYTVEIAGKTYPQYLLRNQNYSHNFECLNKTGDTPLILAWNKFYGESNFGYGLGKVQPFVNHHCPVTNCELTMDKSRLKDADYVIVHMSDDYQSLPVQRDAKTRWVWMLIESPHYTRTFEQLNG